jgi:ABC-2 type transport system permease protein
MLSHRLELSALAALFWLTLRQQCRAKRLFVLAFLFTLPAALAVTIWYFEPMFDNYPLRVALRFSLLPQAPISMIGPVAAVLLSRSFYEFEFGLILNLIPHALIPLAALLYASGMIQDEIEEQTLTYLLIRPLSKWSIYLTKFVATLLVTTALAALFTLVTYLTIYLTNASIPFGVILTRAFQAACLFGLTILGYTSLFGCISLVVRRSLVFGVAYIIVFEGVLANIDFAARRLTIMYYFRVLAERWLGNFNTKEWSIDSGLAPTNWTCILTLLTASLVFTGVAAFIFTIREFRLKTPEGS